MGSSSSTTISSDNNIQHSSDIASGNVISSSRGGISFIAVPPAKLLNASSKPVRVYLDKAKLEQSALTCQKGSHVYFRAHPPVPFSTVPPRGCHSFEVGDMLASVFVQDEQDPELVVSTICVSSPIPLGRNFIVTRDYQIKLQNLGAGDVWVDEDGTDHTSK